MNPSAKRLLDYLHDTIYHPSRAELDVEQLDEEFRDLGKGIQYYSNCVLEALALARALAKGNLKEVLPPPENEIAAPLKDLHAKMKHLTWQAQQIAEGNFQQRIDFMGEFTQSFNTMTEQLEQQRNALLEEIEKGHRKTKALEQSNYLLQTITGKIPQWVIVIDGTTHQWLFANQQAADVLQDHRREAELLHWITQQLEALQGCEQPYATELELQQDANSQYFGVEIHPLSWYDHNAFAFMFTDISSEKEHLCYLQNAAYTDPLTQLYNRKYGMEVLHQWLAEDRPFILCFADIDNLKYVNDRFGHSEGDRYILAVTQALCSFSPEAILCRMGADEFMILAQGWSIHQAQKQMEALRTTLANRNKIKSNCYDHSISYGVIEIGPENRLSAHDLLSIADEKMYEYKRAYKMRRKKLPTSRIYNQIYLL